MENSKTYSTYLCVLGERPLKSIGTQAVVVGTIISSFKSLHLESDFLTGTVDMGIWATHYARPALADPGS